MELIDAVVELNLRVKSHHVLFDSVMLFDESGHIEAKNLEDEGFG